MDGTLREPFVTTEIPPEDLTNFAPVFMDGTLKGAITTVVMPPLSVSNTVPKFKNGTMKKKLLTYSNWPSKIDEESITSRVVVFTNGTLS